MNRFVITRISRGNIFGLWEDQHPVTLQKLEDRQLMGNLYVGRVKNVVPNLHAAFVDVGLESPLFLPLDKPVLLSAGGKTDKVRQGDEVLVQISREASGLKPPALTSQLTLAGHYAVLLGEDPGLSLSSRISSEEWRQAAKEYFAPFCREHGIILRTEAKEASFQETEQEILSLIGEYEEIRRNAAYRSPGALLRQGETAYLSAILGWNEGELDRIVTDLPEVYDYLTKRLSRIRPELLPKCTLYEGSPSLPVVYSVDAELDRALGKRVYLPCGGFLIIEHTEAMTVIDVNSGKNSLKKDEEKLSFQVNREAAAEVCRQMRLRNLSGMILVDFVSMKSEEERKEVFHLLQAGCRKDPVPAKAVDFTRLGLAELTRKKGYKPLAEQFS